MAERIAKQNDKEMTYANIDTDRGIADVTEGLHVNLSIKEDGEMRLSIPASQQDGFDLTEELFELIERPRITFLSFDEETNLLRFKVTATGGNALTNSQGPNNVRYGRETRVDVTSNTCLIPLSKNKCTFAACAAIKVAPLTFEVAVPDYMIERRDTLFSGVAQAPTGILDVSEVGKQSKAFMCLPDELISKLRALYGDNDQIRIMRNGYIVSPRTVDLAGDDSINMQFKSVKRFRSLGFPPGRYEYVLTYVSNVVWALSLTKVD